MHSTKRAVFPTKSEGVKDLKLFIHLLDAFRASYSEQVTEKPTYEDSMKKLNQPSCLYFLQQSIPELKYH